MNAVLSKTKRTFSHADVRPPAADFLSGAIFDRSGKYRYRLWRQWSSDEERLLFVMLNPSRANASENDQTIRTCIGLARHLGFGGIEVVNLFAFCTAEPRVLLKSKNPVGKQNDEHIVRAATECGATLLAWGNYGSFMQRDEHVRSLLREATNSEIYCLGMTKLAHPRHPLYVKRSTTLSRFDNRI